jgi:arsenate reductase
MTGRPFSVLVLCTGNSARSILGEAMLGTMGAARIVAHSAGSKPKFRSKSWNEFTGPDAPAIDLAVTVCGNAAGEACPVFMGAPLKAHWGLPDPADATGDDADIDAAFEQTWAWLEMRVRAMLGLPFETMDRAELVRELARIGQMEGAA